MKYDLRVSRSTSLFLVYVSVMLVITFLQQEFVLLPQLQSLDIVGEESRAYLLEQYQRTRWLSFLFVPVLLILRLSLVTLCLYIGGFFISVFEGKSFKDWWGVALSAQSVILLNSVLLCILNLRYGPTKAVEFSAYTSLQFLVRDNVDQWIKLPLSAINVFEIGYWIVLSLSAMRLCHISFGKSFQAVLSSYGVGYLFYISLMMFLLLYLS